ncbi:MAG: DUF4345 domain-containing protein [Litorimonas sp.]
MARKLLQAGLYFIGIAGILIGGAIALFGIESVGRFFAAIINVVIEAGPLGDLGEPNDDSELRFYSVFFVGYGVVLVQTAGNLARHGHRVPILLGLFFAGGLARLLSLLMVGQPHALFILLLCFELPLPPLLYICWKQTQSARI